MQKYRILTDTAMHLLMYHGRRNENTQTNLDAIVPQKNRSNKLGPVSSSLTFCFDGILKKISLQPFGLLEGKVTARYGYFFLIRTIFVPIVLIVTSGSLTKLTNSRFPQNLDIGSILVHLYDPWLDRLIDYHLLNKTFYPRTKATR